MTTLNAALNYSFASTEASRISSGSSGVEDSIASQIKQAASNSAYQIGATITAKYQYKVGPDGSLVPQQTQITHTAPDDEAEYGTGSRRQRTGQNDDSRAKLSDLVNPKPTLSPTDEVSLFATAQSAESLPIDVTPTTTATAASMQAEVLDENGDAVDAELITGNTASEAAATPDKTSFMSMLAARAQTAAANLYARNSDIIYSTSPIAQIAA